MLAWQPTNQEKPRKEQIQLCSQIASSECSGEVDAGDFSLLCVLRFLPRVVKSVLLPRVTLGGAVHKVSQATDIDQGMRTVQGPKGAFIFTRKGREDGTHRKKPGKAV